MHSCWYVSLCLWVKQGQICAQKLYLLMTITDEEFVSLISNSNKCTQSQLYVQLCTASLWIPLLAVLIPSLLPCCRTVGVLTTWFASPLSSLGFHEARRGCVRPRQHPGSLLCWRPLGVATSRSTLATSSQLLWRDACSQHPIKHSSQTNLRSRLHPAQEKGGFYNQPQATTASPI